VFKWNMIWVSDVCRTESRENLAVTDKMNCTTDKWLSPVDRMGLRYPIKD